MVGMGHIYRALSLANELYDNEVIFITDKSSQRVVNQLIEHSYPLQVYHGNEITNRIISLNPNLVVNDILNTNSSYINQLRDVGIRVVNFEDLGTGATAADLTINELYDRPQLSGGNVLWGYQNFFVREEFENAVPLRFAEKVENILLVFGGTDQHNLSEKIFFAIESICQELSIFIDVVSGPGYSGYRSLARKMESRKCGRITHATGVISRIMEKSQIAITSNGRTVYELAHMNIPSIVIPQHEREKTHAFADERNGFIPMDTYSEGKTEIEIRKLLRNLITDTTYRYKLFSSMQPLSFSRNRKRIVQYLVNLLQ